MLRRSAASTAAGLVIVVAMFMAMQAVIARSQGGSLRRDTYPIIDFIRLAREEAPPDQMRREPPKEPDPPEVPPTPDVALPTTSAPQVSAPRIETASSIAPGQLLDMQPLATTGPGTGQQTILMGHELIPLVRVPPRYPTRAVRLQIEGFVTLEFTINPDGSVSDPEVVEASPAKIFDKAALQAIAQWKFKPREENGRAVASRALQRIEFTLGDG